MIYFIYFSPLSLKKKQKQILKQTKRDSGGGDDAKERKTGSLASYLSCCVFDLWRTKMSGSKAISRLLYNSRFFIWYLTREIYSMLCIRWWAGDGAMEKKKTGFLVSCAHTHPRRHISPRQLICLLRFFFGPRIVVVVCPPYNSFHLLYIRVSSERQGGVQRKKLKWWNNQPARYMFT